MARRNNSARRTIGTLFGVALGLGVVISLGSIAYGADQKATSGGATLSNSFTGLGINSTDPVDFASDEAEVFNEKNMAILTGNVVVRQNQSALRCKSLKVFYDKASGDGQQKVKRLEADQDVLVTSGDQTATGGHAVFDTIGQIITMTDNVVLTQGKNVVRGDKLTIDINAGSAHVESKSRVQMLVDPKQATTAKP